MDVDSEECDGSFDNTHVLKSQHMYREDEEDDESDSLESISGNQNRHQHVTLIFCWEI